MAQPRTYHGANSSWAGDATPMIGPGHCSQHSGSVGVVIASDRAGPAEESRWAVPRAGTRLVSQS